MHKIKIDLPPDQGPVRYTHTSIHVYSYRSIMSSCTGFRRLFKANKLSPKIEHRKMMAICSSSLGLAATVSPEPRV